jgi:hypothetical protein
MLRCLKVAIIADVAYTDVASHQRLQAHMFLRGNAKPASEHD